MNNANRPKDFLYEVKPDMKEMIKYPFNNKLTTERYLDAYTPGRSSTTLIYDQSRITAGPNRFGTRVIRPLDRVVISKPAGMDNVNSTKQLGKPLFENKYKVVYPQNL
jgi:hypothetical protein